MQWLNISSRTASKISTCVTLFIVALFFIIPLSGILTTPSNAVMTTERRLITPFPAALDTKSLSGLGAYIKDRLFLRNSIMEALYPHFVRHFRSYDLEWTTPVRGSHGFWFCGDNWNYPIAQHSQPMNMNVILPLWQQFKADLDYIHEKSGLPVKVFMVPDKHGIYSQYLPPVPGAGQYRLGALFTKWAVSQGIDIYDAYDDLLKASAYGFTHYHQDTHWTSFGAYHGYLGLMRSLGAQGIESLLVPTEPYDEGGDLMYCKVGEIEPDRYSVITKPLEVRAYSTKPQSQVRILHDLSPLYNERYVNTVFENDDAPYPQTVLLLSDSTSMAFTPFLYQTFKRVILMENTAVPLDEYVSYAKTFKADFILFQRIERCLTTYQRQAR